MNPMIADSLLARVMTAFVIRGRAAHGGSDARPDAGQEPALPRRAMRERLRTALAAWREKSALEKYFRSLETLSPHLLSDIGFRKVLQEDGSESYVVLPPESLEQAAMVPVSVPDLADTSRGHRLMRSAYSGIANAKAVAPACPSPKEPAAASLACD